MTFVQLNPPEKIVWDSYLAVGYLPADHGWQEGDIIRDVVTGTTLKLFSQGNSLLQWGVGNGYAGPITAAAPIVKNTLVQVTGIFQAIPVAGAGQPYNGVALNDAQVGERVYCMLLGGALIRAGAVPAIVGQEFAADALGHATVPAAGDFVAGFCISPPLNVDGIDYQICTVSGTGSNTVIPPTPPVGPIATVFTTSGNFVVPAGVTSISVYGSPGTGGGSGGGGGGGGFSGGAAGGGGCGGKGAGGGGGALVVQTSLSVTPGQNLTIIVGAPGVGAAGGAGGGPSIAGTQGGTASNGSISSVYDGASELVTFGHFLIVGQPQGAFGSVRGGGGAPGTALAGGAGSALLGTGGAGYPQSSGGSNGQTSPTTLAGGAITGTAGGSPAASAGIVPVVFGSGSLYTPGGVGDTTASGAGGAGAGGTRGGGSGGSAGGKGGLGREYAFAGQALPGLTDGVPGIGGAGGAANAAGVGSNGIAGTNGNNGGAGRGGAGGAGGGGGGAGSVTGGSGGAGGNGGNGVGGIVVIIAG